MHKQVTCPSCGRIFEVESNKNLEVLALLRDNDGMSQTAVAKKLGFTAAGASWVINRLIKQGKVRVDRSHGPVLYEAVD